jgi:hypothetical protein
MNLVEVRKLFKQLKNLNFLDVSILVDERT